MQYKNYFSDNAKKVILICFMCKGRYRRRFHGIAIMDKEVTDVLIITSDTFPRYYREHIQTVYRIALGIVRIPEEAEDIAADCFTTMIKKAEFNDENHLKAWLIVTAEHRALNVVKSARMKRTVPLDSLPERSADPNEHKQELREMVLGLPDKLKTVTYLYYYEDIPVSDIAAAVGISENNVYRRLTQARKLLKFAIKEGEL